MRDGSAPAPRSTLRRGGRQPVRRPRAFGDVTIGSASGIDDIGQAGIGVLDPPLVAQNGRYVRTLTLFNQTPFDHIVAQPLLPARARCRPCRPRGRTSGDGLPDGIGRGEDRVDRRDRFAGGAGEAHLHAAALVKRAGGAGCATTTIGLIGLHIAQKTPSRPQWIWSSFEQKDVVPPKWADWPGALRAERRHGRRRCRRANPLSLVPLAPEPVRPFNVERDRRRADSDRAPS